MKKFSITSSENGMTLEKYMKKVLNTAPLSFIYKTLRKKDVKVNNHWQDGKYVLSTGEEVFIYITDEQYDTFTKPLGVQPNNQIAPWIIYEDKNIILINKPRNILVQADSSNDKALDQMAVEYLMYKGEYDPLNNRGFKPGPAHRIDRNTSGIVIFGKNRDTLAYLSELIKTHEKIEKHYVSLVVGTIEEDGEVDAPLRKNFSTKKVVVCPIKDGAKPAKTIYHVLDTFNGYTLLDLTLVTGRTHQIRVHMSYIRHHVVGDTKYGDFKVNNKLEKEYGFKNQFLHASEIRFGQLDKPLDYLSNKKFLADMPEEFVELINKLKN